MLEIWQAIILGAVEGVTEFLPISSTGHLILSGHWLGLSDSVFLSSFDITIQLGAILAIIILYARLLLKNWHLIYKVIFAFAPSAVAGLLLYSFIKTYLLGNALVVVWSLAFGGVGLILFERWYKEPAGVKVGLTNITYRQAFIIGLWQVLALIPGVSRAGATVVGGMALGLNRSTVVEFSFLLAIPTMLAASAWDLLKSASTFETGNFGLLAIGFACAFVTAWLAVKWLLKYVKNHTFTSFGVYRIILALLAWWILF